MDSYDEIDLSPNQLEDTRLRMPEVTSAEARLGRNVPRTFSYDPVRVPLYDIIQQALVDKAITTKRVPLEELHLHVQPDMAAVDEHLLNGVTKAFYEGVEGLAAALKVLREQYVIPALGGGPYAWQATPTIRFHFPHAGGMEARDERLLHIDSMIGHPLQEINIWLSLTDTTENRSFVITPLDESMEWLKQYEYDLNRLQQAIKAGHVRPQGVAPANCRNGEFVIMDSRCIHGPVLNRGRTTRVSMDFRLIPTNEISAMNIKYRGCGRRRALFDLGYYYAL